MDFLSARDSNCIPIFEQQVHTLSASDLSALGALFLRHGAHQNFCAGLLHRHLRLREGEAIVHVDNVCSAYAVEEIKSAQLTAHSYCCTQTSFRPYEFALNRNLPHPNADFLHDLQSLLLSRRLENVIALTPLEDIESEDTLVLETQLADAAGSHSSLLAVTAAKSSAGTTVIINWAFESSGDNHMNIREVKACVKNHAGVHEVKAQSHRLEVEVSCALYFDYAKM